MKTRVLSATVRFSDQAFSAPMVLSTGVIREISEAVAEVRVSLDGREAVGRGSILLSDLWAWPDHAISHDERDRRMRALCESIASRLTDLVGGEAEHPLELGLRLHANVVELPALARSVCLSPFDAAIHDAVGIALGRSAFDFYDEPAAISSADALFDGGAIAAIKRLLLNPAKRALAAWVIVNKGDDLETITRPWCCDRNYRNLKIKIMGKDADEDVARTIEVFTAARSWGIEKPSISVDSNEGNSDADSVMQYLQRLRARHADAFAAVKYLEQPTSRDIRAHPQNWRDVSRLKPIMLDEGLTDISLLPDAREQNWSGLAIKTCKGHSFALIAAAWGREHGMLLSMQDLTNPGLAAIHSALFAAHLPAINDVELNSPQFIPIANASWLPRLATLLDPRDGMHRLPDALPVGLGSML